MRRTRATSVAAVTVIIGGFLSPATVGAAVPYEDVDRVTASNPRAAAIAISQSLYDDGEAGAVVLAREDTFPDALGAAALTAEVDAPLLLTPRDQLAGAVEREIDRVLPAGGRVYLLGGEAALAPVVERRLENLGYDTPRFPGRDRIETAGLVARFVGAGPSDSAMLVRAAGTPDREQGWVDSVSCGAHAADTGTPVLLTDSASRRVSTGTMDTLRYLGVERVHVCGGPDAVPQAQVEQLRSMGITVARHSGPDRAATAVAVAKRLWDADQRAGRHFLIAPGYGTAFGYGLAATPLAARLDAPLLLVGPDFPKRCDDPAAGVTLCYLEGAGTGAAAGVTAVGPVSVISDEVLANVARAAGLKRDTTPPPVPTGVTASDPDEDDGRAIDVRWAPVGETGVTYTVYVDGEPAVTTKQTSVTVPVPIPDTAYEVAIDATDEFGNRSEQSETVTVTAVDEVPAAPPSESGLGAVRRGADVLLTWTPNQEADVAGYVIERTEQVGLLNRKCGGGLVDPDWDAAERFEVLGRDTVEYVDVGAGDGEWCYRYRVFDDSSPRNETGPSGVTEYDG